MWHVPSVYTPGDYLSRAVGARNYGWPISVASSAPGATRQHAGSGNLNSWETHQSASCFLQMGSTRSPSWNEFHSLDTMKSSSRLTRPSFMARATPSPHSFSLP